MYYDSLTPTNPDSSAVVSVALPFSLALYFYDGFVDCFTFLQILSIL